jgi:FlaA1/EpsC-like NDP-sugar epimerase
MRMPSRKVRLIAVDVGLVNLSIFAALLLRFDGDLGGFSPAIIVGMCLVTTLSMIIAFHRFRLYQGLLDYASIGELTGLIKAVAVGTAVSATAMLLIRPMGVPVSAMAMGGILCLLFVGGSRLGWRLVRERMGDRFGGACSVGASRKRALLVGAGDTGELVVRDMLRRPEVGYVPVGFVDDNINKVGLRIHGVPILGRRHDIPRLIDEHEIEEVIVAIASAPRELQRDIFDLTAEARRGGVSVKTVPSLHDLVCSSSEQARIRDVRVEELLERSEVVERTDEAEMNAYRGKSIMVTGAAGSIGQELCRQLHQFEPDRLILFDHNENNTYFLSLELRSRGRDTRIVPAIGDIRDEPRVNGVMKQFSPEVIFHAAAHKHVPLMEQCVGEGIKNNVLGTLNVARAADRWQAERFVLISTDKAVNPLNIMGATKRVAELITQSMAQRSRTSFCAVRFGNVLGSEGSVIPLFKRQIRLGGPVTVTHPDVVRYLMTIPEAVRLVIRAGTRGGQGDVFVLKMGNPVRILDLARNLIRLSGFEPGRDIQIEFIGLRPGEKLREELWNESEHVEPTEFDSILSVVPTSIDSEEFCGKVDRLARELIDLERDEVMERLMTLVPEYRALDEEKREVMAKVRSGVSARGGTHESVLRRWVRPSEDEWRDMNRGSSPLAE